MNTVSLSLSLPLSLVFSVCLPLFSIHLSTISIHTVQCISSSERRGSSPALSAGMMPLLCVVLWTVLPLVALSSSDHCGFQESIDLHGVSPPLDSLQCYNDFQSHVHCKWKKHRNTPLQLWSELKDGRQLCKPVQSEHSTVQCRYNTKLFAIGTTHKVFFINNEVETVCSSATRKPLELSQLLRPHPPGNLSTLDARDGGWRLSWSSPYPSSSSLSKNLIYQLSYRSDSEDNWTQTQEVTNTSVTLEEQLLLPGHRYEAKVRARVSVGQWSSWSPVVNWMTKKDYGQFPSLHCVLNGETETTCSWEVSRELAHFITYQLSCRHNQTAPSEKCCVNLTVTLNPSEMVLRYSCLLTITDPAQLLLLELLPKHNAKTLEPYQHIRPKPPQELEVKDKNSNWKVQWKKPDSASSVKLYYEVCYYKTKDPAHSTVLNSTVTFMILQGAYLDPSQEYQVKVRSLVVPGDGSKYKGVPSEWTDPKSWTSHQAPWSLSTFIYILTGVFVTTIFFMLYYTTPACRRKVILWVDSVPSPGKSKILSDIKFATGQTLIQTEDTSISNIHDLDTVSMCSSNASLWSEVNKKCVELDEGFWNSDDLPSPTERVNSNETSSVSFSGPYIFCQTTVPSSKTVNIKYKEEMKIEEPSPADSTSPVNFALYGKGYVCLPTHTVSRSTQDLALYRDVNTNTQRYNSDKEDQQSPDTMGSDLESDVLLGLNEATSRDEPLAQTSESFSLWPEGGAIQASGYCHLPQPQ